MFEFHIDYNSYTVYVFHIDVCQLAAVAVHLQISNILVIRTQDFRELAAYIVKFFGFFGCTCREKLRKCGSNCLRRV